MHQNRSKKASSPRSLYAQGPDLWLTSEECHVSIGFAYVVPMCKNSVGWYPLHK